ncbi:MAG: hypothetical protein HY791_27405 [Deltaproteobacteria bacterium]|nr:hypothetical protein [Deltaproteobacteria bacterium]
MARGRFSVFGMGIELRCPAGTFEALAALWRGLLAIEPGGAELSRIHCVIDLEAGRSAPELPAAGATFETSYLSVRKDGGSVVFGCGPSWLRAEGGEAVTGSLEDTFWSRPPAAQRDFFVACFVTVGRQHGFWGLHANGVSRGPGGTLVVGPSGSGKTTLSLAMLGVGWRTLGDDSIVLQREGDAVMAVAVRRLFAFTPTTIQRFPEVERGVVAGLGPDEKILTDLAPIYPDSFQRSCRPSVLLFPRIVDEQLSQSSALSRGQAMGALMQQSGSPIFLDAALVRPQMEVLASLVRQTRAFEVRLGRDLLERPGDVVRRLEDLRGE